LINPQIGTRDQPAIGGNIIAFLKEDDITGNQLFSQDALFLTITHDAASLWEDLFKRLGGFLCAVFLEEAKDAIDDIDCPNCNA